MKLKKFLSLLLALVMTASLLTLPAHAEDVEGEETGTAGAVNFTNVAPLVKGDSAANAMRKAPLLTAGLADEEGNAVDADTDTDADNGMKISKTAVKNEDGSYKITLEAYATGEKVISEITKEIPTDIILVLDQSGSMANDIGQVRYTAYTGNNTQNKNNYGKRHNGGSANLWHKLSDGSFVSVSVTLQQTLTYNKITKGWNDNSNSGYTNYWENRNNLYTYVNGEIKKVVYTRERDYVWQNWNCKYALEDGTILNQNNEGSRYSPAFQNTDDGYLYLAENQNVYTYTYTDTNGTTQTIGTSTGANTIFTPAFYQRSTTTSGGGTRLDALKNAVNNFADAVHTKSLGKDGQVGGGDDIDHRIALVGFSSPDYNNTELLTGSVINRGEWKGRDISTSDYNGYYYFPTGYEMNGPQYGRISDAQYKTALLAMNTDSGVSGVTSGVNALTAWGGTRTDHGLAMANKIFEQNPIPNGETRNRVVIVFTDGIPGLTGYDSGVASSAITQASTAKSTYGATVYAIGIFSGADATSAGSTSSGSSDADNGNYFLQRVSSNNGTPRNPSYYLSAGDSDTLNTIFKNISDQIETGGSSSKLTDEAVVKDIISPQFTLPEGASTSSITLETYAYNGKDASGQDTWVKNDNAMGAMVTIGSTDPTQEITKDNQVNVTGFNFTENWCGTVKNADGSETHHGNKLVISFNVEPRDKFLGGNEVNTNANAGIYTDKDAKDPILEFEKPNVDVNIKEPTITAPDANVYLGAYFEDTVSADQLKDGTSISFDDGNIKLDMTKPNDNWGLEDWQTEYVEIKVTVKDKAGNEVTDFKDLREDADYTVSVSVTPKTPKEGNNGFQKDAKGTIHVFTPELTFQDSTAYYGESVSSNYDTANKVSEKWTHSGKYSTDNDVTMLGSKPTLGLTYTPDSTKLDGNKYGKNDVPVKVGVKIGNEDVTVYTKFVHKDCASDCGWTTPEPANGDPAFLIHIKTCSLIIAKKGGADDETYVFDVYKDGEKYSEVTIQGNTDQTLVELPVGTYTIQEDTNWSWRYPNPTYSGNGTNLNSTTPTGTITCTNAKTLDNWLNGFSAVVRNIFGKH